ncbi:phage tail tape measure protein TP901 family core region [Clostridium sp. CAG:510]|nr:phage tail tape measure protein TP901 family core region [Clostridium sp. CAG:510]
MAAKNTIGSKIVIEGVKEYNESIRSIKAEQAELRAEMKLCTETYKENANSTEALRAKQEILTRQIEAQNEKVKAQEKVLKAAEDARTEARRKVELYTVSLKDAEKKLESMKNATDTTAEALEQQQTEVEKASTQLKLAGQQYEKMDASVTKYTTALNTSQAELVGMERELDNTRDYLAEAADSADGCATSIDQYGKKVKEATEETQGFGEKTVSAVENLAGALAASGIAAEIDKIKDALMECSKEAAAYETNMAKVYTIADEAKVTQSDMAAQLMEQSTVLVQSSNDLADAAYNAISAGQDTANTVGFVADATKLAIGGYTDATTSVDILTTAMNAYKMEAEQSTHVADALITTQNLGKVTVNELAANMGKVIPIAAAYNVNMDQLSSSYAILTANGIKAAESTTYIKGMLNELGDSGSTVGKILKEETGMSFGELMEQGLSLGDVIEILGESVNNDSAAFNELWSSSEAGVGALSILGSGAEKFNSVLEQMENSTGATEAAFQKMTDTTEYAEKRMQIASQNLQIAIGNELNPTLKELYNTGTDAFTWATEFVQEHPQVVQAVAVVVAGLGTAATAIAGVTAAVAAFKAVTAVTNPLVVGSTAALGALVGAVSVYIASSQSEQTEIKKEIELIKESTKATKDKIDAIYEENDAYTQTSQRASVLIRSVEELNKREKLNAEEKTDLANRVALLNQMYPSLNLAINEETGYLEESTEAFLKQAEAAKSQEDINQAKQESIDLTEAQADAEVSMQNIREKMLELDANYEQTLARIVELSEKGMERSAGEDEELNRLYEENEALLELNAQYEENAAKVGEVKEKNAELTEVWEGQAAALQNVTVAQIEYGGQTITVSGDVAESIQKLQTEYAKASEEAEESLKKQVGLFEELSNKSDMSVEQMSKNLQTQTDAYTQYKDDLIAANKLAQEDLLDENLLADIQSLGIQGASYLHELVEASKNDADAYADVIASYKEMLEARGELSDIMGDFATGYGEQMADILQTQSDTYGQMKTDTETSYDDLKETLATKLTEMAETNSDGIDSMVTGVNEKKPEMQTAAAGLIDAASEGIEKKLVIVDDGSSEVFSALGAKIPESIATGIRAGQDKVTEAVQEVIDNAIDRADLSGIASAIDRKLGEAFE